MLHNAQRDYHFNKDSIAFANQLSDNFISVNRGIISTPEKEATISRYNSYFSSVEFLKWDDVSEPIIKFSDDGSMAYTIVDKIVEVTYTDENGNTEKSETHFAWTAIYKKYGNEWKIDCVTSTNKPDVINIQNEKELLIQRVEEFNLAFRDGDIDKLGSMITDNYTHTNSNSKSIRKSDWLAYLQKRKKELTTGILIVENYEMSESEIEIYDDMAIVTAKISFSSIRAEEQKENEFRVTNVWVKEEGNWKRAGFHDTRIK